MRSTNVYPPICFFKYIPTILKHTHTHTHTHIGKPFKQRVREQIYQWFQPTKQDSLSLLAYDAVLSIALGLNSTLQSDVNHLNDQVIRTAGKTLINNIANINFHGLTVRAVIGE